jgi:hypothetical protein
LCDAAKSAQGTGKNFAPHNERENLIVDRHPGMAVFMRALTGAAAILLQHLAEC